MADQTIVAPAPNTTTTSQPPPPPPPVIDSEVRKVKPTGKQPKPVRELPVVPVATNAAGVLEVLGGAVYQATGVTGLIVAGSVIGGAATVAGVKKVRAASRARAARQGGPFGMPSGRAARMPRIKSPKISTARSGGGSAGGRGGAHRAGGRLPKASSLFPGLAGTRPRAGASTNRPAGRGKTTGGAGGGSASRLGKAIRAAKQRAAATPAGRSAKAMRAAASKLGHAGRSTAGRLGKAIAAGSAKTSNPLRAASRAFRAAMRPSPHRWRSHPRRIASAAAAGSLAAGWVAVRGAMRQLARLATQIRKWVVSRWHRFHNAPEQAGGAVPVPPLPVGTKVRRPEGTTGFLPTTTTNPGGTTMSEASISAHMRALLEHTDQMIKIAAQYDEEDMLVYGADLNALPKLIDSITKVFDAFAKQSHAEFPVHPAIITTQEAIPTALTSVGMVAAQVGPAYQSIHRDQLDRLRNRGHVREDKWNVPSHRGGR